MNRELLEKLAVEKCSSEIYYELHDFMDIIPDEELQAIIDCNGDYKKELKIWGAKDE
jgi:hypothetical protein